MPLCREIDKTCWITVKWESLNQKRPSGLSPTQFSDEETEAQICKLNCWKSPVLVCEQLGPKPQDTGLPSPYFPPCRLLKHFTLSCFALPLLPFLLRNDDAFWVLSLSRLVSWTMFHGDPPAPMVFSLGSWTEHIPLTSPLWTHCARGHFLQEPLGSLPLDLAHPFCTSFLSSPLRHLVIMRPSSPTLRHATSWANFLFVSCPPAWKRALVSGRTRGPQNWALWHDPSQLHLYRWPEPSVTSPAAAPQQDTFKQLSPSGTCFKVGIKGILCACLLCMHLSPWSPSLPLAAPSSLTAMLHLALDGRLLPLPPAMPFKVYLSSGTAQEDPPGDICQILCAPPLKFPVHLIRHHLPYHQRHFFLISLRTKMKTKSCDCWHSQAILPNTECLSHNHKLYIITAEEMVNSYWVPVGNLMPACCLRFLLETEGRSIHLENPKPNLELWLDLIIVNHFSPRRG